ncbi:MFS transporter [Fulvivirgaceae bacterium PWU20]|uniref:MFS transporter n=2 Tax=Chryseosolibacter indicus TaxID=2782351 RepID=A0ABS5VQX9_9BACT|nr:MFS transporter [Chryseosolibacter indicus]
MINMQKTFSPYQIFIITILTITQFTVILDFMVLSPLGAILLKELSITTAQFGMVVSAYAFSAGASGLLAAGFADKFDRKKLLLFFYIGFIIGTALCAIATDYIFLLTARIITGLFGGVIGSICYAIVTDLFKIEVRGRVMGFLQMAFAGSQVLGIPTGLYFANLMGWHSPFWLIVLLSIVIALVIAVKMKPIDSHLKLQKKVNALSHLGKTISQIQYLKAFAATTLLATGGFMLMPFASTYNVNNMGINLDDLPLLYMVTGVCSMATGPVIGKLSDSKGKFTVFLFGSILTIIIVLIYCNLGLTPLWGAMLISIFMFIGVSSRMIPSQALLSAVPSPQDRGAFMSINSSVMQVSGGIATFIAGTIIVQRDSGYLENYDRLGYVVSSAMVISAIMIYYLNGYVKAKIAKESKPAVEVGAA